MPGCYIKTIIDEEIAAGITAGKSGDDWLKERLKANNPTLAGGRLYLRNDRELICYDVSQGSEAGSAATFAGRSESLPILLAAFLVMNGLGLLILGALSRNSTTELTAEEDAA